ncbi:DUF6549 family protein [Bacteroides fragilis]
MNKLNGILSTILFLLGGIVWLQHRHALYLTEERDRFRMNNTALLSGVKRMQIDSATMALETKVLRLTVDEYKEFRAKDAEIIRRLGIKVKKLEVAARHKIEVKVPVDAVIQDTLIIHDSISLTKQKVEMVTPHIKLTALIEGDHLRGDIKIPVTFHQAVWVEYKGWWLWKRIKAIRQTISSDNPHVEIKYSEYI